MSFRKRVRLLIVDDDSGQFDRISAFCEMYTPTFAVECRHAHDQGEALALMHNWQPSVVLLDLHLEHADSLSLVDTFVQSGTPVVATSTAGIPNISRTAESHGAAGYVIKSDDVEDLEPMIEYVARIALPLEHLQGKNHN